MAEQQNLPDCVAQHLPFVNRLVWNLTRGDQMAEDIAQQTVLKALISADQFRFESALKTWLACSPSMRSVKSTGPSGGCALFH